MKMLVLSDLQLKHSASLVVPHGLVFDVVVPAGDINLPGGRAVKWAQWESTFGSNPRGYRMKDGGFENAQFDSGLVIALGLGVGVRAREEEGQGNDDSL